MEFVEQIFREEIPQNRPGHRRHCAAVTTSGTACDLSEWVGNDAVTAVVPLCLGHRHDLEDAFEAQAEATAWQEAFKFRRLQREHIRSTTVVYFLRRSNGDIKIGYSCQLGARRSQLEKDHGPLELLAAACGGRRSEKALHERFAAHRLGFSEWFRPHDDLLAFVTVVADMRAHRAA